MAKGIMNILINIFFLGMYVFHIFKFNNYYAGMPKDNIFYGVYVIIFWVGFMTLQNMSDKE